jgi:hypothetical protein
VAYVLNKFMDESVRKYFVARGIEIDPEKYSLLEMRQFLYRGRIRKGMSMDVFIPSSRMRRLLYQWLEA